MSRDRLETYKELLRQYHGTLDLMSAKGLADIDALVADAAAYADLITELVGASPTVLDVGSGAGLPGIVIAAGLPAAHVHLVERRRRRGAFLEMVVARLELESVRVWTADVAALDGICADVVTAQAVTTFSGLLKLTRHLRADPCHVISRRGSDWSPHDDPVLGPAPAEDRSAIDVVAQRETRAGGTLVALRIAGGPPCRPSV